MNKHVKKFFEKPPYEFRPRFKEVSFLRYGENGRLPSVLFKRSQAPSPLSLEYMRPVEPLVFGHDVSRSALTDLDRALRTLLWIASVFEVNRGKIPYIAVGVKHGNACGASYGDSSKNALIGMIEGDPRALFGGTVVTNFSIGLEEAELLHGHKGRRVIAGITAPAISREAYDELKRKSRALIAFENHNLGSIGLKMIPQLPTLRDLPILGCLTADAPDMFILDFADKRIGIEGNHEVFDNEETACDLWLAWAVCWTSNSNTITIARQGRILVNSVGGQDRVGACEVAGQKLVQQQLAGVPGLVFASDSFFPFDDGPLKLHSYGINIGFTTRGGEREREVAQFFRDNDMSIMWIEDKIARGFYGH